MDFLDFYGNRFYFLLERFQDQHCFFFFLNPPLPPIEARDRKNVGTGDESLLQKMAGYFTRFRRSAGGDVEEGEGHVFGINLI